MIEERITWGKILWRRFKKNKLAIGGAFIVVLLFIIALFAPLLSPYDPEEIDVYNILSPPTRAHPLGTDELGRDILSRIIWGSRISLEVGFVATGIAILLGITLGTISGYYGGLTDNITMRFVDIMLCFPTIFLILAVIAMMGPNITNIMVIIGLTGWMGVARMVRAEVLSLKEREFIQAARVMGASNIRIIARHILPNATAPVFVAATLGVAGAILTESGLSYLGLGVQPPTPSWGNMLSLAKANIEIAWWLTAFPGLAILVTVLGYTLLGEGLRDILDPRLK